MTESNPQSSTFIRWWRRHFPDYRVCWYRDCGELRVGIGAWCREHTDRILAHEHCNMWPLRKGAKWTGDRDKLYPCAECDALPVHPFKTEARR